MRKRFHITIKDNEAGEVCVDLDTDCIIGAIHSVQGDADGSMLCGYVDCDAQTLGETIFGCTKVAKELASDEGNDFVRLVVLAAIQADMEGKKDGMDSERKNGGVEIPFPAPGKNPES